jgi:hypothetical protein
MPRTAMFAAKLQWIQQNDGRLQRWLTTELAGYSFSQRSTKFRLATRTMGPTSGTPGNITLFPRDCSLRASEVTGFRRPVTGILAKPTFIVAAPRHPAQATMLGLGHRDGTVPCHE